MKLTKNELPSTLEADSETGPSFNLPPYKCIQNSYLVNLDIYNFNKLNKLTYQQSQLNTFNPMIKLVVKSLYYI